MRTTCCLTVLLCCLLNLSAGAQDRLLSPSEFLGYELGSRFTPHHRVVAYVEHVAAHSPNVHVEQYGETYEGRPLLVAFVTSPENLARLDEIRQDNLRLAGLLEGTPQEDVPALVWLSYNVHGNESVSTEAAMATLHDLAIPENARTQAWLDDAVVIIDPCLNPDGRVRYVHWYTQVVGRTAEPDPDAREHHEPWPGGRVNHYYFDLNRDWAWATQQETQYRLALYNQWMPHVHVDFHEQGVNEPYYFAPAAEPFHAAITDWQREFQTTIGLNNARYFDHSGWLYFTRQRFDLFYPGYGDTWPIFNGAVGMTYEQGGSGRAGLGVIIAEGDTLTLRERILHHYTTGLSTIEATANDRERVIREFRQYFERASAAAEAPFAAYVVKRRGSEDKIAALASHLDQQEILYGYATGTRTVRGRSYGGDATRSVQVEPGDLIVSTAQPKGVLARVLFDPESALSDSLTYDVTSWSLPYVYGVEAYALTDPFEDVTPVYQAAEEPVSQMERPYAYLAEWKSFEDAKLLAALLAAGVKLRFTELPFEVDGRRFDAGTLIITRTGNEALGNRFDEVVRTTAAALGQPLVPVGSGFVASGPDFGSSDVPFLRRPRVAVLSGDVVSAYALGEIWHFFDRQLEYPVTLIDHETLGRVNLYDYDVLVLPSGSYGDVFADERLRELKDWIRAGGRLIAMERAAAFFAGKEDFALKKKAQEGDDGEGEDEKDPEEPLRSYADRERAAISEDVPGAVFRVHLDPTHPLAFGYGDTYYTLKRSNEAFAFLEDAWNVGVLRDGEPVSGFAGAKAVDRLEDTLVFGVQDMGSGEVVYFLDDPLFRGFWYNGRLLFSNAVFLTGQRSPRAY